MFTFPQDLQQFLMSAFPVLILQLMQLSFLLLHIGAFKPITNTSDS